MSNLFIPVILGTVRQGRMSEPIAQFIVSQIEHYEDVDTELIDIRTLPISTQDAGRNIKDPGFAETMHQADGMIIVIPEYNHSYPGMLKHVLDTNYEEYRHKAVGLCGVSAGTFGGIRAIESLLPTLRVFGLATIATDLNFSEVTKLFDASGTLLDEATHVRRFGRFMKELVWMAKTLKYGRENIPE